MNKQQRRIFVNIDIDDTVSVFSPKQNKHFELLVLDKIEDDGDAILTVQANDKQFCCVEFNVDTNQFELDFDTDPEFLPEN